MSAAGEFDGAAMAPIAAGDFAVSDATAAAVPIQVPWLIDALYEVSRIPDLMGALTTVRTS